MSEDFLVLVLVIAIVVTVIALLMWITDKVLVDKPAKPKVDLSYDPLKPDVEIYAPGSAWKTPEGQAKIEKMTQDLRYNPLSTDEDICMPVRSRPPSES